LDGDGVNLSIPGDTAAICNPRATSNYTYPSCGSIAANSCAWTQCQDNDVDFALALVDYVKANLCVDVNNVFATGGSNGGMFSWELGQNAASAPTFRAIAPLIGLPHRAYLDAPAKTGDMPVLVITGTNDTTVPPGAWKNPYYTTTSNGEKYYYSSATGITRVWAAAQGCSTANDAVPFNDGYEQTDCRTYCSNDTGWPRVLDCRANMGHVYNLTWSWPLILDFFDHHAI
jgi:poly(3-hydroxybutyrate) depolymerase